MTDHQWAFRLTESKRLYGPIDEDEAREFVSQHPSAALLRRDVTDWYEVDA
jgi:hypothetical protein